MTTIATDRENKKSNNNEMFHDELICGDVSVEVWSGVDQSRGPRLNSLHPPPWPVPPLPGFFRSLFFASQLTNTVDLIPL